MLEALLGSSIKGKGLSKEIPASELITGAELKALVGITTGTIATPDPIWIEVEYKGTLFYIAKTAVFTGISWTALNGLRLTTGIDKVIKGKTYTVRSLQGALTNGMHHPSNIPAVSQTNGTEWNDVMADLLVGKLKYNTASLGINTMYYEWTRESGSWYNDYYKVTYQCGVVRGYTNNIKDANLSTNTGGRPWRPILVLVPPVLQGEIKQSDFITYPALAEAIGLTQGSFINTDTPWLKIVTPNGKTRYWPKQSIMNNVSHAALEAAGMTDGKLITIGSHQYRVRLPTGVTANPGNVVGGEWKEIITALTNGTWASYTADDLATGTGGTYRGEAVFMKEKHTNGAWVCNGYPGLQSVFFSNQDEFNLTCGFRPILDLVA